jgi:hypothetical protein
MSADGRIICFHLRKSATSADKLVGIFLLALCTSVVPSHAAPKKDVAPPPKVERPAAAGTYLDSDGAKHAWRVAPGHALLWDNRPYLPVGVVFHPESLREAGEAAWERDAHALDALKAAGVLDLTVTIDRGLAALPAGVLARLVDGLRERGFRYGLAIDDRPQSPLRGYWLKPAAMDVAAKQVAPGVTSIWTVPVADPGVEEALYALVDTSLGTPLRAGRVPVTNGKAQIEVNFPPARRMFPPGAGQLFVLPVRTLGTSRAAEAGPAVKEGQPATPAGTLASAADTEDRRGAPDLWASLPAYQAGLLEAFNGVRWGPGLRFFLNPIDVDASLRGDVEELLPASEAFRVEFEAWLQKRGGVGDTSAAWGLNDRHLESLQVAARLVPLWRRDEPGPGVAWLIDPETMDLYRVDRRRSRFWSDLADFRVATAQHVMNVTADLLKQRVAEVPVLYRWTQLHRVYTNPETVDGWDGLAYRSDGGTEGRGDTAPKQNSASRPVASLAAPLAYAQCEGSARTLWCVAIDAGTTEGAGTPSRIKALRDIGARGYFVEGEGDAHLASLGATWAADPVAATERPAAIFFPMQRLPGAGARRLSNGVWWLPSYASGRALILGESVEGYQIDLPFADQPQPTTYLWSTAGAQKVTLVIPRETLVGVYDTLGQPVKTKMKDGKLRLDMTELPFVLTGLRSELVFPVEATAHALAELDALLQMAETRRLNPNVLIALKAALADARSVFTERTAATAFDLLRGPLESLRELLSPYLWIEGEHPREHTFDGVAPDPGASDGAFLSLSRARDPSGGAYVARYTVNVNTPGLYELWLAGSAPGQEGASPIHWQTEKVAVAPQGKTADGSPAGRSTAAGARSSAARSDLLPPPPVPPSTPTTVGPPYGPGLSWTRLGAVRLEEGRHVLTLSVSERGLERYLFRIDALLLAREPFQPDGIRKPSWRPAAVKADAGR